MHRESWQRRDQGGWSQGRAPGRSGPLPGCGGRWGQRGAAPPHPPPSPHPLPRAWYSTLLASCEAAHLPLARWMHLAAARTPASTDGELVHTWGPGEMQRCVGIAAAMGAPYCTHKFVAVIIFAWQVVNSLCVEIALLAGCSVDDTAAVAGGAWSGGSWAAEPLHQRMRGTFAALHAALGTTMRDRHGRSGDRLAWTKVRRHASWR